MTPEALYDALEARLFAAAERGADPWTVGVGLAAARLDCPAAEVRDGVFAARAVFASVVGAADPRRWRLARPAEREAAQPALILLRTAEADPPFQGDDLIAWSLKPGSRRVWRMTCACAWLGEIRPTDAGVVRLYQDAHLWLRRVLKAEGARAAAREARALAVAAALAKARNAGRALDGAVWAEAQALGDRAAARWAVECVWPDGALVLDPAVIPWTRSGALAEAEEIEIVDAPAGGPLGRALQAMNPRIGTARGVPLRGVEPARRAWRQPQGRRAA